MDSALSTALAAEIGTRSGSVVSVSGALSSAVSSLVVVDSALSTALAAEIGTRSGSVLSVSTLLSSAVSTLTVVDSTLSTALAAEIGTRSGSVVSVSTTLYNAVSSITLVNSAQSTILATEVATRGTAVSSLATAFATASTAFQAADATLSTSIGSLTTQVALKANKTYLDSVISQVIGNAPTNLDTLYEIAAALNNNNNFAGSITTVLATKADATAVTALATTLATKANQSDLATLSTLVGTKADTATVSTMQINVTTLANAKDTLVGQVSTLITTGGNVNSSNVGVNGVTLTDLSNRAKELYYKLGYVNGDGTINYKINNLLTPTLVSSWLEFVLDVNNDIAVIKHNATVRFDKYQTNVSYTALGAISTINNISLDSNNQYTFTATYIGGTTYYTQNASNLVITALDSTIRSAPVVPTLNITPPVVGTYKYATPAVTTPYAATTWSDATGLISQPLTIQTDSGAVIKFDTGTYSGVSIELFSGATLVSDKTFSTTGASSTYLVKYAPSIVGTGTGAISVRALNSTAKVGSDVATIANVFNNYVQYAAPTMVANSKNVSKSGAAYTYTATFTNADSAAMQVLNADNSVASAQPTVGTTYSYVYDSSKIGSTIFKINVQTSGSKRASTYLVVNGEDLPAYAAPVLSGSVAYAGTAGSYSATATHTFNANVSAVKVMKSDGTTIIASQAVTSGTATLVISYATADISGTKSFYVVALGNSFGTDSVASTSYSLLDPPPVLSNFTVGAKALADGAFGLTAPTSTVATTYATNAVKPTILFTIPTFNQFGVYQTTANGAISGDGTMIAFMSSFASSSNSTLQIYKYNSTPSTYVMNTMTLNGTTNGIQLSDTSYSYVIGLVSGKKGTISMWWNLTGASSGLQSLWASRNNATNGDTVRLARSSDGSILFKAGNDTTNMILATTTNTVCASAGMYHMFVSWDTSVANRVNILINGVQQTLTIGGFILNSTIEYNAANHGIGGYLMNPFSPTTPGMVGQVYVNYVEYVDPSNIGKFYGGANTPVGLGENGNVPTGSIPTFYIEYSPACSLVNLGSSLIRFLPYGSLVAGTTYTGTGAGFGNYWSQLGGDIVANTYLGMIKNTDPSCISMSANGKLICVNQENNQMTIVKFDDTKTIAPAKWIVSQLTSNLTKFGHNVVLSGDGNTLVVWAESLSQVFSTTDGGTTWTQKGQNLNGTLVSTSISANGSTIVAVISNVPTVYTWYSSSWVSSTPIGSGNHVAISGDGKIINKLAGWVVATYSLNASTGAWNSIASNTHNGLDGVWHMSTSFDGSLMTVTSSTNNDELRLFRYNGSSNVSLIDQRVIGNRSADGAAQYYPYAAKISYTGRFIIGGRGMIGVYDIIRNGAITYTSSNPSVADLYGNGVFMKATGTSTITATQTTATGTGTISDVLTIIPQFAAPVLSSKVFALTATPGSFTFTATCTVEAAVAQIKIIKTGSADTILSVTNGSVSISMSYATADMNTPFYVVALANGLLGSQSNYTSQLFLDPPPVLSNFVVGAKALADITFVLTAPTSTMNVAYNANSITPVGQSFTGLTVAAWNVANLVRISADGTTIGIVLGTSAGTVRMYRLISNTWTQIGGDITGTANGLYAGVGFFNGSLGRSVGDNTFSMSADGTLLTTVQSGLGGFAGLINIYKYDVSKSTAQTTNTALPTYGPANWSRVATIQMNSLAPNAVLSGDGKTMAVTDGTLRMYRSDDGGATWPQRGAPIVDPANGVGFAASVGISANGLAVIAGTLNGGTTPQVLCYEWDGATWNASLLRAWGTSCSCSISANGKVCLVSLSNGNNTAYIYRYTKNVSGVWTLDSTLSLNYWMYTIHTSSDGTFVSLTRSNYNVSEFGNVEIYRWNGTAYVAVINEGIIKNRTGASVFEFNAMLSSDGNRVVVGGNGKVDVYDLTTTGKTTYTSSAPAVASVYGNLVFMKATGTSTITATQTNAMGSGTITDVLTVYLRAGTVSIDALGVKGTFSGTTFNHPRHNTIDLNGNIFVADSGNNVIRRFTSDGVYVSNFGGFSNPQGIAISYITGNIYVVDTANHRVQILTGAGAYVSTFGSSGTGNGQFNNPWGVAIDAANYVYVTDQSNHRIQKFTSTGTYVSQFGSSGTGNGQFAFPKGIEVLLNGNILVLDSDNHRIQKFTSAGVYVSQFGSSGTGNGQLAYPMAFAIDATGNIVVADTYNNRIQIFNSTGTYVSQFGSSGTANGNFNRPQGIAINLTGNIIVSDTDNNRVQIL